LIAPSNHGVGMIRIDFHSADRVYGLSGWKVGLLGFLGPISMVTSCMAGSMTSHMGTAAMLHHHIEGSSENQKPKDTFHGTNSFRTSSPVVGDLRSDVLPTLGDMGHSLDALAQHEPDRQGYETETSVILGALFPMEI